MTQNVLKPCPQCPYARTCEPGALGGSTAETFIGQAYGPFMLPCHKHCDFSDPHWKAKVAETPQCAGAAIFRTHIGANEGMPNGIHRLPSNPAVFHDAAEFLAHHLRGNATLFRSILTPRYIVSLVNRELKKPEVKTIHT